MGDLEETITQKPDCLLEYQILAENKDKAGCLEALQHYAAQNQYRPEVFWHGGSFDLSRGDTSFEPWTHFGSKNAAMDRVGGKVVDDGVAEAEVEEVEGRFYVDEDSYPEAQSSGFSSKEDALTYIAGEINQYREAPPETAILTPVFIKQSVLIPMEDLGTWGLWDMAKNLTVPFALTSDQKENLSNICANGRHGQDWEFLASALTEKGAAGIIYKNKIEDPGSASIMILDPCIVKSAEPILRNSNGQIIGLEERFACGPDIRGRVTEPELDI